MQVAFAAVLAWQTALASLSADDVLAAATANYSPEYAARVERLLAAAFEAESARDAIGVQVALLAAPPTGGLIGDGATLRDGHGDPSAGDRIKVRLRADRTAFVYAVGIDTSGRVVAIFPDAPAGATNPVVGGRDYVVPGGDAWWALDERRGVEHILALASLRRRADVEAALDALASAPTQSQRLRSVTEHIAVPPTRGIVTVGAAPVSVRWFRHE